VAPDALDRSLSEHGPSLERQVKDLTAILNHLLACINETRGEAAAADEGQAVHGPGR